MKKKRPGGRTTESTEFTRRRHGLWRTSGEEAEETYHKDTKNTKEEKDEARGPSVTPTLLRQTHAALWAGFG